MDFKHILCQKKVTGILNWKVELAKMRFESPLFFKKINVCLCKTNTHVEKHHFELL